MADQEQVLNRVQNLLTEVGSMDAVALDPEARKELAGLQNTVFQSISAAFTTSPEALNGFPGMTPEEVAKKIKELREQEEFLQNRVDTVVKNTQGAARN